MSEQANANVVRSQFDAYNAKDHTGWSQSRGAGYAGEQPGAPGPMNAEQMWMYQETFRRAFPDLHLEVTRVVAAGDDVVAHWTATGTHNGPLSTPGGGSSIPQRWPLVQGCCSRLYQIVPVQTAAPAQ